MDEATKKYHIESGLILCTLRHYQEHQSLAVAQLVQQYLNQSRVVGFDIAADEANFSIENHNKAFSFIYDQGIPATAHAGEARGAESVWETLDHFKVKRIGHGVRSIEDQALIDKLVEEQIYLEVCPTSNVQTNTVSTYSAHPIQALKKAGIILGVNTDGRTISNISLSEEYEKMHQTFGWGQAEFKLQNTQALNFAFCNTEVKSSILSMYYG